jgi:nucleotide-binding universal stress UspA family protein
MTSRQVRRILVALDASPHSQAALEEAAALAASLEAELTGIFVLDTELLRFSALPTARETGLTTTRRRSLDPTSMERSLRLQAKHARAALENIARHHRLQTRFRLIRGNVLAELLQAAAETDLMALGAMGHMGVTGRRLGSTVRALASQASCSVLLLTPDVRKGSAVMTVFGQSADAELTLDMAAQLAARREAGLVVLLCGPEDARQSLQDRAAAYLEAAGLRATFHTIAGFEDLNRLVKQHDCGLLVLGCQCELIEGNDEALGDLDAPVLLVRQ